MMKLSTTSAFLQNFFPEVKSCQAQTKSGRLYFRNKALVFYRNSLQHDHFMYILDKKKIPIVADL